ncbi:MAG: Z1 domain-containing protein [Rhizomicrobium sp.]
MPENAANLENLEIAVEGFLAREANPTPERIRELIAQFRVIPTCSVDDETAEFLARRFEARHGVTMTIGSVLTEEDFEPWLDSAKPGINPYYWSRYKKLLAEKHFSTQVMATLDDVTDRILGLLENPLKPGPWDRRGMVVGHVQSGKTANYTGLICKAADAGYRLIIVIAGIHNNLRNQTQLRIDEGFVGRDSARLLSRNDEKFVGVGRFDQTRRPVTFTNSLRDFSKAMATSVGVPLQNLNEPVIFVIKKNSSTLKNLLEWLAEHNASRGGQTVDTPMLVIDDEADNASINIGHDKGEVSRINGHIRSLLRMFARSCYIGYTATPFANIFIDPDTDDEMYKADLFPRNFIVSLDPPTNYFGPSRVFIQEPGSFVRHIDDNEDTLPLLHTKELPVAGLPASLVKAIRSFVVARAIRLLRGHVNQHCSMLINASRFTEVQRQIRNEVHNRLERMQSSARINGALPESDALKDPEIAALHDVFEAEYAEATEFSWLDVQQKLNEAAAPIKAVEVNSRSSGTLNYAEHEKTGLNVIAVGGFSLSRGLTLEGLMISYFLRNSMMYDTLMQMGRWFGYRPDYDDLCRIWMLEEAEGWYSYVAESIEMLREELRRMEVAGGTPEDFGLKVRSHPTTLIVTARNKMGSGEELVVNIGLGNSFVETVVLRRDRDSLEANRAAVDRFAKRLAGEGNPLTAAQRVSGGWLLEDVNVEAILGFLSGFQNHPGSIYTDPGPVRRYIQDRAASELLSWDVLFASLRNEGPESLVDNGLGVPIICQFRKTGRRSDTRTLRITDNARVSSRGVEKAGLTDDQRRNAEQAYRAANILEEEPGKTLNYPDRIYREQRIRPLLIVHLLQIREMAEPVVAWSISFPKTAVEETRVEFVVNTTWMRENYPEEAEDEEAGDDDE